MPSQHKQTLVTDEVTNGLSDVLDQYDVVQEAKWKEYVGRPVTDTGTILNVTAPCALLKLIPVTVYYLCEHKYKGMIFHVRVVQQAKQRQCERETTGILEYGRAEMLSVVVDYESLEEIKTKVKQFKRRFKLDYESFVTRARERHYP